jgi:hypothetical protein
VSTNHEFIGIATICAISLIAVLLISMNKNGGNNEENYIYAADN